MTMIIMPVYHWFLPPFMIIWGTIRLLEIRTKSKELQHIPNQNKLLFLLFLIFFVWQILGMLYSDNPKEGWRNIELRLSLLLFPLVLVSPGELIKHKSVTLIRFFAISTFIFLMICFGYAFFRSLSFQNGIFNFNPHLPVTDWLNYFYGLEFAIFQHPSYLSMFALLSAFIALESFFDMSVLKNLRYFWFAAALFLLVSLYFLSSRAGMLAALITVPFYLFRKLRMLNKNKYLAISIVAGILILLPVLLTNPRVNKYSKWRSGNELSKMTLEDDRIVIWQKVSTIMRKNIIFGVGTGDIQDELNEEYRKSGNNNLAEGNFNAHNQYLEVILENGLIGLTLFLSIFAVMAYISIKEDNLIYLMFIMIVFFSFLFETMLNRLAGVSFFSLFSFLLIYSGINKQKVPE